jgi:hypothetical protein
MTAINDTPKNINFLSPLNFKFVLKRSPTVNFFIQKVNIPSLTLPSVPIGSPLITVPYPGEHLQYDDLIVSFKIDEDLQNYLEIHNWIRSLGKLDYHEYATLNKNASYSGNSIRSDIDVEILNSYRESNYKITYKDAFPTSLSGLDFDTTSDSVDYISATATFKFVMYDISKTT